MRDFPILKYYIIGTFIGTNENIVLMIVSNDNNKDCFIFDISIKKTNYD